MEERVVEVPTPSGRMPTFVTHPEVDGPFPPVVIYMDIWGVREELFEIARRVGTVGYYCMVPDFYYREGHVRHEFRDAQNRMISLHALDEERRQRVRAPGRRLSNQMVVDDTGALLEFLRRGEPARAGGVGAIGYCMGGRHVLCAAGHFPDRVVASASLHGTSLISDAPDSPHRLAKDFRGELYCGFAEMDPYAPLSMVKELDELLRPCSVAYRYHVHAGAQHGYALPNRDIFDARAAARDWEVIFAMFHRQIPASATGSGAA
jgi:carboxymethylenebutenolidase